MRRAGGFSNLTSSLTLHSSERNFELVAENLGSLLEDIVPPGKPVKSQIQASFITWSHNVWNNAAARMKSDLHGQAPNGQYNLNDLNF